MCASRAAPSPEPFWACCTHLKQARETRSWLSYQLEKYREVLADLTESLVTSRVDAGPSTAKVEGQRVIREAKDKAEQLLGDVDQLINQINSRKTV